MKSKTENIHWKRMRFRTNKVWLAVDDEKPIIKEGKVLIKYQLDQHYEYWVQAHRVKPLDAPVDPEELAQANRQRHQSSKAEESDALIPPNAIQIFTDGASSGNPGPAGIGVIMLYKEHKKEVSRYIGISTNNIAELTAIKVGLESLKRSDLPVRIYTDSDYSIGILTKNWKPHKNRELVESIKHLINKIDDFNMIKVKGHSGHLGNEQADFLAVSAIKNATP